MVNSIVRGTMEKYGITQTKLAEIMEVPVSEVSVMLKYSLTKTEQKRIIEVIMKYVKGAK